MYNIYPVSMQVWQNPATGHSPSRTGRGRVGTCSSSATSSRTSYTWHVTLYTWHYTRVPVTRAAPGTTSGGVLAPSTATASTASSSPRCATETRIARTTWELELQTIHRQSLQLYFAITVIPATLKVSLFRVTRRTAHTAPRVEPSSVRSRLNTGWSINMHHW